MAAGDVAGAIVTAGDALWGGVADDPQRAAWQQARLRHALRTDPGGCWVAEGPDGVVGVALAIVREGLWGLSLLAVRGALQGRGVGRRLLDAALGYGEGARGAIILSSEDPRAMRRYARAGFALRPCVTAAGVVHHDRLRDAGGALGARAVAEPATRAEALALAAPASRFVRGAAHGEDLGMLLDHGSRMLALGERGFVVHRDGSPRMLAARDEEAAAALLAAALRAAPRGATVEVAPIAAGHDWAIDVALRANLALSPSGPVFTRGEVGPLAPYLPSGAWL
jgi:GNAT superfamily N-acetyltransferase